jgi:hypothetical protein
MRTSIVIATLVAATAVPAFADNAAKPAPAATAAAAGDKAPPESVVKLVQQIMPRSQYDRTLKMIGEQLAQMLADKIPGVTPADMQKAMAHFMPYEWIVGVTAGTYYKRFTQKELDDIGAFYRTPTGKKLAEQFPEIMADTNLVIQQHLQEKLPGLIEELSSKKKPQPSKL